MLNLLKPTSISLYNSISLHYLKIEMLNEDRFHRVALDRAQFLVGDVD